MFVLIINNNNFDYTIHSHLKSKKKQKAKSFKFFNLTCLLVKIAIIYLFFDICSYCLNKSKNKQHDFYAFLRIFNDNI